MVQAKARLVSHGFKQREGVDYFQHFFPDACCVLFSFLGAIVCQLRLYLCHFDAERAFVQSSLKEDVLMRLPPGCGEVSGKIKPHSLQLEAFVEVVA